MELSIFHDGQFFIGLIEYKYDNKSKFAKYTFGTEPDDGEILCFIDNYLLILIENTQTSVRTKSRKQRVNPKRLQRQVAKEQKASKDLTKAQLALKEEQELKKKQSKKRNKAKIDAFKERKRKIKKYKAKEKHKGH
ncbi:YjdF family protein [Staphylococcus ureilyticus]|uniref:YjdF family protein n=1 Tax=Staphylococcus ureilyticus TaxID=94138 RepID=UPI0021D16979|nr:YjdF family protein [Staphylococcus ureilyticus]UXS60597.1 YjdF family protein [Staphylococcus ureilyticus]